MRIYCMSDIHGCLTEFEEALSLVRGHLNEPDVKLIFLGDYVHGGAYGREVIDTIIKLQYKYGHDKVIALLGNHDEWVLEGMSGIDYADNSTYAYSDEEDNKYLRWIAGLPRYYTEGNTIFVHAGIDEEAGDMWEWGTGDEIFTMKYPAEVGKICDLDMKVVAGHVGTAEIAGNPHFHDIYFDGESHYYIDGTVLVSRIIPVMMVDTKADKYYKVTKTGNQLILPYE